MNYEFFDIHSHLNIDTLYKDRDEVMQKMIGRKVGTICVGTDFRHSELAVQIANEYKDVWATVGQHPADNHAEEFVVEEYEKLLESKKVVAIGECGLDYYRLPKDEAEIAQIKNKQKELFIKHVELAVKYEKPLMIHARPAKGSMDAYEDVLEILKQHKKIHANFHFFVGDMIIVKQIVENGWTCSFDGPITFARDYDEVIKFLPLENIMAETDAPFAAPEPYRGKQCEPWMVEEVYKKIAEIKQIPLETVQKTLLENVKRVFDIGQ